LAGRARRAQGFRRALKKLAVGQHRQAGRAVACVIGGDFGRREMFADHALRRAGLLDLGDHRDALDQRPMRRPISADFFGVNAAPDRAEEIARCGLRQGFVTQRGEWFDGGRGCDFSALDGENFLQNVGHRSMAYEMNCGMKDGKRGFG
jgi:hypothetical protein